MMPISGCEKIFKKCQDYIEKDGVVKDKTLYLVSQ